MYRRKLEKGEEGELGGVLGPYTLPLLPLLYLLPLPCQVSTSRKCERGNQEKMACTRVSVLPVYT